MPDENINYVKEVMQSEINYAFVGIMAFLMFVFSFWGFFPLLLAGEISCLFIAQNSRVQRIIRSRKNKNQKIEIEEAEVAIVGRLPVNYQADFRSVRVLCDEIEKRSKELDSSGTNVLLGGLTEKLSSFRYEYARMLRAHHLLSTRNYRSLQSGLAREISRTEDILTKEQSLQVKQALAQNLNILKQRLERIKNLDELVRLIEARLQVIRNSLSLIQDEVYSFTDVAGISGLVDNLLTNLKISDEFRTAYEDVLSTENGVNISMLDSSSETLSQSSEQSGPKRYSEFAKQKEPNK